MCESMPSGVCFAEVPHVCMVQGGRGWSTSSSQNAVGIRQINRERAYLCTYACGPHQIRKLRRGELIEAHTVQKSTGLLEGGGTRCMGVENCGLYKTCFVAQVIKAVLEQPSSRYRLSLILPSSTATNSSFTKDSFPKQLQGVRSLGMTSSEYTKQMCFRVVCSGLLQSYFREVCPGHQPRHHCKLLKGYMKIKLLEFGKAPEWFVHCTHSEYLV